MKIKAWMINNLVMGIFTVIDNWYFGKRKTANCEPQPRERINMT